MYEDYTVLRQQCKLNACQNSQRLLNELNKAGFQHFVLHLNFIPQVQHNAQLLLWTDIFGTPIVQSEMHVVYQITSKQ